ncbi:MAG: hypothetical protein IJ814_02985 [Paludibacteraceae bacterium]|nr:hypothetical protein [Paludibacteraceae bacterium]
MTRRNIKFLLLSALCLAACAAQNPPTPPLNGRFSVSEEVQVLFSPGNLYTVRNTGSVAFAGSQYAIYGMTVLTDTTDWFLWDKVRPYATKPLDGVWRIMSDSEWNYLLFKRPGAEDLMGQATVCDVCGLIVLPDEWECPDNITWQGLPYDYTSNLYSETEWVALENSGAVFLPAAGRQTDAGIEDVNRQGWYWAATNTGTQLNKCICFGEEHVIAIPASPSVEIAVRMVQNVP